MAYIGRTPTGSILTGADIADGSISTSKIADNAIVTGKITDGTIATGDIADSAVTAVKTSGVGISMADQWRLSADFSLPAGTGDITSNIERADSRGAGQIGSAMTVSSGVFTFPSTGFYLVTLNASFYTAAADGNNTAAIKFTSDNSSYLTTAFIQQSTNANSSVSFGTGSTSIMLDITNTSTHKIKIEGGGGPSGGTPGVLRGSSEKNETTITFVRLGDT